MQTNNDTAPPWHFWSAERKSLCGVPVGYPQRFTDRLADVTCADCRSRMQKVESASTPMQTDETRAREVLGKEAGYGGPIPLEVDGHPIAVTTIAAIRAMLAFAAPPAVEREEGQPTLADIEHRSLRLQGESANAHGLTVGEPVSEWIAGRMKDAADRALAPSTPTLHPSDREAIAREVLPIVMRCRRDAKFCAADAANEIADAILALSGSLAPANPTEKGEL